MSGSVEVVTSELHVAADRLRSSGQRLQDGLSAVDLETGNLLGSGWKGEAATAFEKYWDQWHTGAGQVVRALQSMSDALDEAARTYAAQDEEAGGALGSSMQGGGGSGSGAGSDGSGAGGGSAGAGGGPAGAGAPTGAASGGPAGAAGSGSGAGGESASLADSMNLGQVMQPLSQVGAIPAQMAGQLTAGLVQAGQLAAGAAQQAVQAGIELAQQVEAEAAAEKAEEKAAEEEAAAERAAEDPSAGAAPGGAAGGEAPGPAAPVAPPHDGPTPDASRPRSL